VRNMVKTKHPAKEEATRCYSIAQIQEMLPLGKTRIYQSLAAGDIPCLRLGRRFIVPKKKFDEWLEGGCQTGPVVNVASSSNVDRAGVDQIVEHIGRRLRERGNAI
jgi:excisionase family DNA binding protein